MKLLLAPMEGVVDPVVRRLFSKLGGLDFCVTEFLRVTSTLYPEKVFFKNCPELKNKSCTLSGTPVFLQLLGSDLNAMAENAHRAAELGAYGIDLNFGCPAKTVNRHDGGAALLKEPQRVYQVTEAVRRAVPSATPVTVKVRLGYADTEQSLEIAKAAEAAGAHWLTVHARTKLDGYRPPAHWEKLAPLKESLKIPLIANGDIWSVTDWMACKAVSGCEHFMLGRGLMARPDLARQIRYESQALSFWDLAPLVMELAELSQSQGQHTYALSRSKQFVKLLSRNYPEAKNLFELIKRLKDFSELMTTLKVFFAKGTNAHVPGEPIPVPSVG